MIQEKDLMEFYDAIKTKGSTDPQHLLAGLQQLASKNDVPCQVSTESVKFGSLLKSHVEDCLRVSHPDHMKDYFSIIVHAENGKLVIYRYGFSKEMGKKMEKQQAKKGGKTFVGGLLTGHEPEDGYMGNVVGAGIMMKGTASAIFHGIKSLGGNKEKLKEEEAWYDAIYAILNQAIS